MVNDTHRRERVHFGVLLSLNMYKCKDGENLANVATILVQDMGTETDKLFILSEVNGVPCRTNKVLEQVVGNTHTGEAILAIEERSDEGADLGEVERVVGATELIHLHDEGPR